MKFNLIFTEPNPNRICQTEDKKLKIQDLCYDPKIRPSITISSGTLTVLGHATVRPTCDVHIFDNDKRP